MKFLSASLLFLLSSLAAAAPTSELPKAPLDVQLSLTAGGLEVNVTNTGSSSLDVISIHTPLSAEDLGGYIVTAKSGVRVPYAGIISIYLTDNLPAFHQTIAPTQTITTLYPLSDFNFTNLAGPYQVSTSGIFQYLPTGASPDVEYDIGEYESNVLSFDEVPKAPTKRNAELDARVYTEECTTSQSSTINSAGSDYGSLTNAAVKALTGGQDTAYTEFFGKSAPSQYQAVTGRFYQLQGQNGVVNTIEDQPYRYGFSCLDAIKHCTSNIGAYVVSPASDTVTFCPAFFGSRQVPLYYMCSSPTYVPSNDGYYYRGATLLHELMHVSSVMSGSPVADQVLNGATVYGYAAAKKLASASPTKARINPDNYKYFAEVEYARTRGGACNRNEL